MKNKLLVALSVAIAFTFASCSSPAAEETAQTTTEVAEEAMAEETMIDENSEVTVVKLEETTGEFTTKELTLKEGTYSFEVTNKGIDHEVAFVLAPNKENLKQEDWIADAMLEATVKDGETSSSKKAVKLEKGEYVYFCPMNPTPQYKLTVE